jgi:hypothetical protein
MRKITWLAEDLLAFQEELSFVELISYLIYRNLT